MTRKERQRWLIGLLAITSIATTTLIGFNALVDHDVTAQEQTLNGGANVSATSDNPPVLFDLPSFNLVDQSGARFGSEQLRGKIWIADFIFSRCAGPCPMMTHRLAQLQEQLSEHPRWEEIHLVSVSVDGDYDTPGVLQNYAQAAGAIPQRWKFLTGAQQDIWNLVLTGFRLPVGEAVKNAQMPILHSQKFVLVDRVGRVRGYYDALEPAGQERLLDDLSHVLPEAWNDSAPRHAGADETQ